MIRILLAEDDTVMREYLPRALEKSGYAVSPVDRGIDFQPQFTDDGAYAYGMHTYILLPIITATSLFVLGLLLWLLFRPLVAGAARARRDAADAGLPYADRKRVALARALVARPRLLLLDEPAGGLGAEEIERLGELIKSLDCSVLLVEHHMDLVMSMCDDILVLDFGKPVAFGTPDEIRRNAAVTEAYLGEAAA